MARRVGSLSLGARVISRELRHQPAVVASLFVGVLLAVFVIGATPRLFEKVAAEDLYATVSDPLPSQRNVRIERIGRIGVGRGNADVFDPLVAIGDSFAEEAPESVQTIISDRQWVLDSAQLRVGRLPGEQPPHPFPTFFRFHSQEGIDERVTIVEGTSPQPQEPVPMLVGLDCPHEPEERDALQATLEIGEMVIDADCRLEEVPHFEVAVTAETAEDMGLEVGHPVVLTPDTMDSLYFGVPGNELAFQMLLTVSGIMELTDVDEEYWFGDPTLHRPSIRENADLRVIYGKGLLAKDDYLSVVQSLGRSAWRYTWRWFVSPERVRDSDAAKLQSDLTAFELEYSAIAALRNEPRVFTVLPELLRAHLRQRAETVALMSLGAASLLAIVVAMSVLLAYLMTERQRHSIVLERNRGASPGQLTLTRLYEALLVVVPAAILGYFGARFALAGTDDLPSYRSSVVTTAAVLVATVAAGVPLFRRRLGSLQREQTDTAVSTGRSLVFDIFVVMLAAGATISLRRRGQAESTALETDLLLVAMPALIGLGAALIVLRVYPYIIRMAAWVGSLGRGLVWFVGFRRVLQQTWAQRLPVLVILMCVATASYASVQQDSIVAAQEASSWQVTGSDYAIKGFGPDVTLPRSLDVDGLRALGPLGTARSFFNAKVVSDSGIFPSEAIAVTSEYDDITGDSPTERRLPQAVAREAAGTADDPLPVIISNRWPAGFQPVVGDVVEVDLDGPRYSVVVVEVRERYPDVELGRPFVVLSLDTLATVSEFPLPATVAYLRGDRSLEEQLRDTVTQQSTSARVISRYEVLDSVARDPFISWVNTGLALVLIVAVVFAIASSVSALALATAVRRRDLAYLTTMGLVTRHATAVTVIEQFPALLTGAVAGALTGVGTALALAPAVDLGGFTGDLVPASVVVSWPTVMMLAGILLAVMSVAVVVSSSMSKRDDPARILRIGDL